MFGHHKESQEGAPAQRFQMRERLVSFGDDYWITDATGEKAYKGNGKALRARKTLLFEDAHGHELLKIQEKWMHIHDTMEIEDADGKTVATVKKAIITPFRDRWEVKVANGPEWETKGNVVEHAFTIEDGHTKVAEVSKKWFRVADSYGIEVEPGQDPALVLAVTVVIDEMAHPAK